MSSRLQLLIDLAIARGDALLDDDILTLAETQTFEMGLMGDGRNLPEVVDDLRNGPLSAYHASEQIAELVEKQIVFCINSHCDWPEDLEGMSSDMETHADGLNDAVQDALTEKIEALFSDLDDLLSNTDAEDHLESYKESILILGQRIHRDTTSDKAGGL